MKTWQTWIWIIAASAVWFFVFYQNRGAAWTPHQIVGIAIAVVGFALWALARLQLGRSFAIQAKAKELVTHGLYSRIQNPVYVFSSIFIAGLFVFFWRPQLFLFFLILIPVQWMRIR